MDVDAIIAGLSEAQKRAISAPEWSMMGQYQVGLLEPLRFDLLAPDGNGFTLSETGLAVRARLLDSGVSG